LQAWIEDRADFEKVWKAFGRGQLVRTDLATAAEMIQKFIDEYKRGEPLTRGAFVLLKFKGTNVSIEEAPYVHRLVDTIWDGLQAYDEAGRIPETRDVPISDEDIERLQDRKAAVLETADIVKSNYLDLLLPYFMDRGWQFELDNNGTYTIKKQGE
ncbi:MAG: hypothetical protein AAFN16_00565, partial [Pseudomonadota bacterium]